jgi:outer membrane protein TolC
MEELPDIARDEFFFQNLPTVPTGVSTQNFSQNPALKMAQYDLEANEALLKQINRSWTPKMEFWGTTYARGSGISYDGSINNSDGWSFSRYNYGLGLQLVFPILDLTNVKLKSRRQEALLKSSESNFKQTQITINKQENTAFNDLANSLNIAHEVPVEYKASEEAYRALQTRYNAGLIDYSELIQTQYDLLNAEASLKNACVDTWKSLLKLATIRGDINIFLNQIQN